MNQRTFNSPSELIAAILVASGFTLLFSSAAPASGFPTYQHIIIDPNPGSHDTVEKALADIQGNGKLDAVMGDAEGGGLWWYEQPSTGNLTDPWIKHQIASGSFYEDAVPYDVNGDGAVDLIVSNSSVNAVVWYENPRGWGGNPATDPWIMHFIRSGSAHEIRLADLDGDGKVDIITSSSGLNGTVSGLIYQNSPDSWTPVSLPLGAGAAVLDIGSGLGAIDVVSGDGNNIVWWENPRETGGNARTGNWVEHIVAAMGSADGATFATGVFSASGRQDIIAAENETNTNAGIFRAVAPADRRNGAWALLTIDPTYMDMHKIAVGDLDGDGTLDFVAAEQEQSANKRVTVFYNDGSGNFTQQVLETTGGQNQVLGDVDGDGDLDILTENHGYFGAANPLELWVNQLHSSPQPPPPAGPSLQDGDFETSSGLSPYWNVDGAPSMAGIDTSSSHAHSGNDSAFIWDGWNNGSFVDISQSVSLQPNTVYTVTGWIDASNTTGGLFGVRNACGTSDATVPLINTDPGPYTNAADYQQYTVTFQTCANTSAIVFAGFMTSGQSSFINIDDVSIIQGSP
jgi:hypothetical protein